VAVIILSDRPIVATHLRRVLLAQGRDCSLTNIFPVEYGKRLAGLDVSQVIFVVLPECLEDSTALIRQLRAANSSRIICVGIPHEPRLILDALHAGADDYIDETNELDPQVADVLLRIEATRHPAHPAGKVVTVTSASGGVGCTMIASNLALAFARRLSGCGVIDLSSEHGEVGDHFNLKPRHALGDLLREIDSLDSKIIAEAVSSHVSGVSVLAGGLSPDDVSDLRPEDVHRLLKLVRPLRPCWVVDADRRAARQFHLAGLTELLVMVVRLDFPALCSARRVLDEWQDAQVDAQKILIVANRVGQPGEIPPLKVESFLRRPVDVCLVDDPLNANVSLNCAVPLLNEAPKSALAERINSLAERIVPTPIESPDAKPKPENGVLSLARMLCKMTAVTTG